MSDGGNESSTVAVMADAQFSAVRVVKPFPNFEAQYQGQSSGIPIMFPGTLDPRAGANGVAPNLLAGIKMPLGARVCIWVPVAVVGLAGPSNFVQFYDYTLHWRLRNVADFRQARIPYHFPRQSPGAPDSTSGVPLPRLVIPAANDVVIYEQPEPGAFGAGVMRVVRQTYRIGDGGGLAQPLTPSGAVGILQQGVLDPADGGGPPFNTAIAGGPIFQPIWTDCMGDELMISVIRSVPAAPAATWDFTSSASDLPFSNIYGTGNGAHASYPDLGIYVMEGTSP